jgi:hypothetical protein
VIIKITNFAAKVRDDITEDINNNEERLNPLNDYLFMKYMSEEGDEEQLITFLTLSFALQNGDTKKHLFLIPCNTPLCTTNHFLIMLLL